MPCPIKNPANVDLSSLESHIQGMYDHFDQKIGFSKPPTMVFDSDPSNQPKVLGKTAYYDPMTIQIHIYSDGRHPKDMLRSIAHELIHHQQNMEGRLDVGGYSGPGYYLENDKLREIEQEAMLRGNALMREYEDTIKKESNNMSLKEWKNKELNTLLLKKFGILKESADKAYDDAVERNYGKKEDEEEDLQTETYVPDMDSDSSGSVDEEEEEVVEEQQEITEEEPVEESKVNIREVVRRVLENNKKVMKKLKDS